MNHGKFVAVVLRWLCDEGLGFINLLDLSRMKGLGAVIASATKNPGIKLSFCLADPISGGSLQTSVAVVTPRIRA